MTYSNNRRMTKAQHEDILIKAKTSMTAVNVGLKATRVEHNQSLMQRFLFPDMPEHYSLAKKLHITKFNTILGARYILTFDAISILLCFVYLIQVRNHSYFAVQATFVTETFLVLCIFIDTLISCYISRVYVKSIHFVIDAITVFPTVFILLYVMAARRKLTYYHHEYVSLLKLVRILRLFRTLHRFNNRFHRSLFKLFLTFASLVFIASGLLRLFENVLAQVDIECQFIGRETSWSPSCSEFIPAEEMTYCDCDENRCVYFYDVNDPRGEPSYVTCEPHMSYNAAVYFILITVSLVGYGADNSSMYSKALIVALIVTALFTLPSQFNDIEQLVNSQSQFRKSYKPAVAGENHVILCGHVNDKHKLSSFLQEFLHPDRMFSNSVLFHVVILHPCEPSAEIVEMITNFYFYQKVTYVVGSSLVVNDLKKARAEDAFGIFFLCDTEITSGMALQEDVATVTRALSVSNFNPNLSCFVQVLQPREREILQDAGIELILCLDEFKTSLMAKNAICPGISTFVENLFHSFGGLSAAQEGALAPWHQEYIHGARMEIYFVALNMNFLIFVNFDFQAICDIFFVEFETIVLGVASEDQTKVMFNPTTSDMNDEYDSWEEFFEVYNVIVVLAESNVDAEIISNAIKVYDSFEHMLDRVVAGVTSDDVGSRKRAYVTKYKKDRGANKSNTKKKKKLREQAIIKTGVAMVNRSTAMLRGGLQFRSGNKALPGCGSGSTEDLTLSPSKSQSPVASTVYKNSSSSGSSDDDDDDDDDDDKDDVNNNRSGADADSDVESADDDAAEYVGFTADVRAQRNIQRLSMTESGNGRRLPTRVHVDTNRSLTPYCPKLISHVKGESKNPLAALKLGEHISTSVAVGHKLHANTTKEVDLAVRESARKKSITTFHAVTSIVKMSKMSKLANSMQGVPSAGNPPRVFTTPKIMPVKKEDSGRMVVVDGGVSGRGGAESAVSMGTGGGTPKGRLAMLLRQVDEKFNEEDEEDEEEEEEENAEGGSERAVALDAHVSAEESTSDRVSGPRAMFLNDMKRRTAGSTVAPVPEPIDAALKEDRNVSFASVRAISHLKAKTKAKKAAAAARVKAGDVPGPPLALLTSPSSKTVMRKIVCRSLTSEVSILEACGIAKDLLSTDASKRSSVRARSCSDGSAPARSSITSSATTPSDLTSRARSISTSTPRTDHATDSITPNNQFRNANSLETKLAAESVTAPLSRESPIHVISPPKRFSLYDKPNMKLSFGGGGGGGGGEVSTGESGGFTGALAEDGVGFLEVSVAKAGQVTGGEKGGTMLMSSSQYWRDFEDEMTSAGGDGDDCNSNGNGADDEESTDCFDSNALQIQVSSNTSALRTIKRGPSFDDVLNTKQKLDVRKARIQGMTMVKLGFSDSDSESSSVFSSGEEEEEDIEWLEGGGNPSKEISDAMHLTGHIVVFGCSPDNLLVFISDLRNPQIKGIFYHPIVIVDTHPPERWTALKETYNDLYFMPGDLTRSKFFNRINIEEAYACVLMHNREALSDFEIEENVDSKTIISYLKIEHYVPTTVAFSVELICKENMNVLNSTLMNRASSSLDNGDTSNDSVHHRVLNRRDIFANQLHATGMRIGGDNDGDDDNALEDDAQSGHNTVHGDNKVTKRGPGEVFETSCYAQMLQKNSGSGKVPQCSSSYCLPPSHTIKVPHVTGLGGSSILEGDNESGDDEDDEVDEVDESSRDGADDRGSRSGRGNSGCEVSLSPVRRVASPSTSPSRRHQAPTTTSSSSSSSSSSAGGFTSVSRRHTSSRENPTSSFAASSSSLRSAGSLISPTLSPSSSRSSQLWQSAARSTVNRRSFASHHLVGSKSTLSPVTSQASSISQFQTPPQSSSQQSPQTKVLLKSSRRTVTHQNKLTVVDELGQKQSAYTLSAAFRSLYGDESEEEEEEGVGAKTPAGKNSARSGDEEFSFVREWKDRSWMELVGMWTGLGGSGGGGDVEDRASGGCVSKWTSWWSDGPGSKSAYCDAGIELDGLTRKRAGSGGSDLANVECIPSLVYLQSKARGKLGISDSFWDASTTHYILPIFASGRAYVPSTFETLLAQSFFGGLAPMICELFVCGQGNQAVLQVNIPEYFVDKTFTDLFTFFSSHRVVCLGLYRAPQPRLGSLFPYLYLSPPGCAEIYASDRAFVFGSYSRLNAAMNNFKGSSVS